MVKISVFGQDPLINIFSLSCGQTKYFVNMLVVLSDNILLPFVDGTDLFDANFIKKVTLSLNVELNNKFNCV
jgi:hypothetical protein